MTRWMLTGLLVIAVAGFALADESEDAPRGPAVGKPAPDFRLNTQDGEIVQLSEHGKDRWTVLAFYPKAATPG